MARLRVRLLGLALHFGWSLRLLRYGFRITPGM
jgi:hypothetical protein